MPEIYEAMEAMLGRMFLIYTARSFLLRLDTAGGGKTEDARHFAKGFTHCRSANRKTNLKSNMFM